jgi:hypothetical protein
MFKRIAGKLVPEKKGPKVVIKDGHRLAVLRPVDPKVAERVLAEAEAQIGKGDQAAFDAILNDGENRIFVGVLGHGARALDPETLADLGPLQPGDSFIKYDDLAKMERRTPPAA